MSTLKLTLDEIEDAEIALLRVHGENKVERGVVPVNKFRALPPLRNDPFQVVAERVRPLRHLLKDALYHAFLRFFAYLVGLNSGSGNKTPDVPQQTCACAVALALLVDDNKQTRLE